MLQQESNDDSQRTRDGCVQRAVPWNAVVGRSRVCHDDFVSLYRAGEIW